MILRSLTLAGGLAGAAATSQFPEFSQQYLQRLGGAVDALRVVVADFDASAVAAGLSRDEALGELRGSAFLDRRRVDVARTIDRFETLRDAQRTLAGAGPFARAAHLPKFTDPKIASATWASYRPAVPLTFAGFGFALIGLIVGGLAVTGVLRVLRWPISRRRSHSA